MPTRSRRLAPPYETTVAPGRAPGLAAAPPLLPVTAAWSLDIAGQRLAGGGREHLLSALQFRLLRYFVQHPEAVLARAQLLDVVWGEDFVGSERVVDQAVCGLRHVPEADPSRPRALRTKRGTGYLFVPPRQRSARRRSPSHRQPPAHR